MQDKTKSVQFGSVDIAGKDSEEHLPPEQKLICKTCDNDSFRIYQGRDVIFYCTRCNAKQ